MGKHTEGRWHFYEIPDRADDGLGYIRTSADSLEIAHSGDPGRPAEENRANGYILAAATDLLAALKNLTDEAVNVWEYPESYREIADALDAIEKAEGRQP